MIVRLIVFIKISKMVEKEDYTTMPQAPGGRRTRSRAFGRRVSFLAEGVKRDSEESHLLKTVASGGAWHSEEEGEEALLTRL